MTQKKKIKRWFDPPPPPPPKRGRGRPKKVTGPQVQDTKVRLPTEAAAIANYEAGYLPTKYDLTNDRYEQHRRATAIHVPEDGFVSRARKRMGQDYSEFWTDDLLPWDCPEHRQLKLGKDACRVERLAAAKAYQERRTAFLRAHNGSEDGFEHEDTILRARQLVQEAHEFYDASMKAGEGDLYAAGGYAARKWLNLMRKHLAHLTGTEFEEVGYPHVEQPDWL